MSEAETVAGREEFFEAVPAAEPVEDYDATSETPDKDRFTDHIGRPLRVTGALLGLGVAGRVALQGVPSVEPIIALAVAAGFYYNWRHGAALGAAGFFATNFLVWGGHGPWTIAQVVGAGIAGASGGVIGTRAQNKYAYFGALITGVLLYEFAVNAASFVYTPWAFATGPAYLIAAVPYVLVHVASTLGFGVMIYGMEDYLKKQYR